MTWTYKNRLTLYFYIFLLNNDYMPDDVSHPGLTIQDYLEELDMNQADLDEPQGSTFYNNPKSAHRFNFKGIRRKPCGRIIRDEYGICLFC